MQDDNIVKLIMDIDIRFASLENNSKNHYIGFDEIKAELFKVEFLSKIKYKI